MSRPVATLSFAGCPPRAYTMAELLSLAGLPVVADDAEPAEDVPEAPRLRVLDERETMIAILREARGRVATAADLLGVTRGAVYQRCKKLGIPLAPLSREVPCASA